MDLGVNIDHIATIRQARGTNYPSVLDAATLAEKAGADSITLHLREDRRHMQDKDLYEFKPLLKTKMNLELGYEVALKADANSNEIKADKTYYYEAEQGALEKFRTEKSIKVIGQTLIDMGNDNFDSAITELQSKNLMRFLINYYLGDKPLNSKQLFLNI